MTRVWQVFEGAPPVAGGFPLSPTTALHHVGTQSAKTMRQLRENAMDNPMIE